MIEELDELYKLHIEMGDLISELNKFESDDVLDLSFYDDIIRDYTHDNMMLSRRLIKVKNDW